MGMTITLRPYQLEACEAVETAVAEGVRRPAVVLPTGGGKTIVFAELARRAHAQGRRPIILVHRDELARQAASKIGLVSGLRAGIVKAEQNETDADVIVASVQTLRSARRIEQISPLQAFVVVDECHHATAKSYRDALDYFGCFDDERPDSIAVGVTATMERGDGARLGEVWQRIVYQRDVTWMIRKGYLTDVKGVRLVVEDLDMSGVRMSAGDFSEGDMGEAIAASSSPEKVAQSYVEHCTNEDGTIRPGILFAPTVETARLFADALNDAGIRATCVHGAMPTDERRKALADYEAGRIDVLCNCMVLTEGFDSPRAEVCVIARPTTSSPLYQQMVGRILRLFQGKAHALVIDVVGASEKHPLSTLATLAGRPLAALKEGQTLLEAIDAFEEENASAEPIVYRDGNVRAEVVDLFHGSRIMWEQTAAGLWYIPCGAERYIALVPSVEPGAYDVAWFRQKRSATSVNGGWLAQGVPDLSLAMAYAESDVTDEEELTAVKERKWRNRKASDKTVAYAKGLGIDVTRLSDAKGGTVSSAITHVLATRRIDGPMQRYAASNGIVL